MSFLPSLSDLPTGKNLLSGLAGEIFKMVRKPSKDRKDSSQKVSLVILMLFALFCVIATEPFKVVFRKRIGERALDIGGIIASCTLYLAWAIIMLGLALGSIHSKLLSVYGMSLHIYILLGISISYFIITAYILWIAMDEHYRAKSEGSMDLEEVNYRGDSIFMERYKKKGWSQGKIWHTAEPRTAVIWGLIACICPPFGFPILLTAICFWVNEWYHGVFIPQQTKARIRNEQLEQQELQSEIGQPQTSGKKFYVR